MGYTHGTKWTYEKLEIEVKKVMKALGLERMPSRSEIHELTGKYSLVTAISNYGGFLKVANKMGLSTKGRNHNYKWNEEKIKEGIKEVMVSLDLERMPSNKEVLSVTKDNSLSNKITKTFGFYGWADKLGLEIKDSDTQKSRQIEKEVVKMIKQNTNLKSKITSLKAPYDILVNGKVKIEVKYSGGYKDQFYSANLYKGLQKADILIFVCRNEKIGNKNLIIPSHHLQGKTQLGVGKNSKYDKYIDCWEYIEQFNEFMENLY